MVSREYLPIGLFLSLSWLLSPFALAVPAADSSNGKPDILEEDVTQGALRLVDAKGNVIECPLKHTDVKADIAGFISRVKVSQVFHNPTNEKIEAVYVFPLPHEAAVDEMTMVIGDRKIVGLIKRRAEAREIYQKALAAGQTAALLEQERPNIFTQSVGNIEPGQEIRIEISYVDVLKYDMGTYEFHFPVVVGPRYNPGTPMTSPPPTPTELQGKVSPPGANTSRVPDAARITPPYMKPEFRNGHEISLSVTLNAGVPVQNLTVANHKASIDQPARNRAAVTLAEADAIPNKDFVLRYGVVGQKPEMAVLAHAPAQGGEAGYFMLMIQPKEDERLTKSPPREIVFMVDVSGSMSGEPTAKNIEIMQQMLKVCRQNDTIQVITFDSQARKLFDHAVPANDRNIKQALNFTEGLRGGGGTEMLKGVKLAIDEPLDKDRLRIVVMLTDGYIGNEAEIIEYVGKQCGDQIRFWCVGIGQAPNMFLVDGVAKQGGGMGKKLGLKDDSSALAQEIMTRIQRAQLAKIRINWGDLKVSETYPARIPELWAGRPVILFGRYAGGGKETVLNISGNIEGQDVTWPLAVFMPAKEAAHEVVSKVWARQKIEDLMQQTYYQGSPEVEEMVTSIALQYRLMSQYTSFVAVDEKQVPNLIEPASPPRRMLVPLPLPEGTQWEGFFGERGDVGDDMPVVALRETRSGTDQRRYLGAVAAKAHSATGRRSVALERTRARDAIEYQWYSKMPYRGASPMQQQAGQMMFSRQADGYGGGSYRGYRTAEGVVTAGVAAAPAPTVVAPARPNGEARLKVLAEAEFADRVDTESADHLALGLGRQYTASGLSQKAEPLVKAAQEALKAAHDLRKKSDSAGARLEFSRAYFLDTAATNVGHSNGAIAAEAEAALEEIHGEQVKAWAKVLTVLDKKLDLVIRDKSIPEAIAVIEPGITLVPGSIEDAAALLNCKELRVSYLDLRGATVAQALDWLLRPVRMNWWEVNGRIVAGSDRRHTVGESAWVYDVSLIALPSDEEFGKQQDYQKAMAAAQKAADDFLRVVRTRLKPKDEMSVTWYAPGQMLVIGNAQTHATAEKLFADLADPTSRFAVDAAPLHKLTSKRAQDRAPAVAKLLASRQIARVAAVHQMYAWKLLAAAADGKLDLEALTELQIAWKSPETAELLRGKSVAVILRSLWAVVESSQALPGETELAALAESAGQQSREAKAAAMADLKKNPEDVGAFTALIYATLASRRDQAFTQEAVPLLTAGKMSGSPLTAATVLAKALLVDAGADRKALGDMVAAGVMGEDMVVLTAIACCRIGGETWEAFRAAAKETMGDQPLPGSVVILVNRLANPRLPLVAAGLP